MLLLVAASAARALPVPNSQLEWQEVSPTRLRASLAGSWVLTSDQKAADAEVEIPAVLRGVKKAVLSRTFFLPEEFRERAIRLVAHGIFYESKIWINDKFVAGHRGGFSTIILPLESHLLRFGAENKLRIEVDGELDAFESLPPRHAPLQPRHPVGIYRDIYLEVLPRMAIENVQLRTEFSDDFREAEIMLSAEVQRFQPPETSEVSPQLSLFAELRGSGEAARVIAVSRKIPVQLQGMKTRIEEIRLAVRRPRLWAPGHPQLYQLTVYLASENRIVDVAQQSIGLRKVEIRNNRFFLNGEPLQINGVDWIEELAGVPPDTVKGRISLLMRRLRALGANALRVPGHPVHPELVEDCSREGIFLLEEIPAMFLNGKQVQREVVVQQAERTLEAMILRDRLQPAVLGWGIGGYLQEEDVRSETFVSRLHALARELDSRPVYLITRRAEQSPTTLAPEFILLDRFAQKQPVFVPGDFSGRPVLPILGSFLPGFVGAMQMERQRIEAEEMQADALQRAMATLQQSWRGYTGHFIHVLSDWIAERPTLVCGRFRRPFVIPAGLLDLQGNRRIAFQMAAAIHLDDRRPTIAVNSHPQPAPPVFTLTGIAVILMFLFFLNRDKRLRGHLRRVFVHPHGFYMDIRENRKVPSFLTLLLGVLEGLIWGGIVAGGVYALRDDLLFDEIVGLLSPSAAGGSAFVWLAWHPVWMIVVVAAAYLGFAFLFAAALKIISFFRRQPLPFMQYMTLMFWTGTCFLPLAIIAPIFYRLAARPGFLSIAGWLLLVFIIWELLRLYRGIRVLYLIRSSRAALILALILGVVFGGLAWYYQDAHALFDYLPYYRELVK